MNFEPFKCLSFDCYGTLIDWESGLQAALSDVLQAHQVTSTPDGLLEAFAKAESAAQAGAYRPYRDVLRTALATIGDANGFQPSTEQLQRFSTSVRDWPAFSDTTEALRSLATRFRLIILSNIDDDLFQFSQQRLGVEFDSVFTAQQIGSYKPSRNNFRYLIDHAGVPQPQILHVAQSLFHDIAPAKEMGLSTVWVNRRAGSAGFGATPAAQAEPDLIVPDLRTLADLAVGR